MIGRGHASPVPLQNPAEDVASKVGVTRHQEFSSSLFVLLLLLLRCHSKIGLLSTDVKRLFVIWVAFTADVLTSGFFLIKI